MHLNYHHLLYFWEIARQHSVSRAARALGVSQPTVSAQLKALEASLGEPLFLREGRELVLTEVGQTVFEYANEIFTIGRELQESVASRRRGRTVRLRVGVTIPMPPLVAHALIRPALRDEQDLRLTVCADRHERLMVGLQSHEFDLVLAHEPAPASAEFKGASHALGESGVSFLTAGDLHRRLSGKFPMSMHEAPLYLPTSGTSLRRGLDNWFAQIGVRPRILGEFGDAGLLQTFGQGGTAIFPCLTLVERQVAQRLRARVIGRTEEVRERFFAITSGHRISHAGVVAICKQPRLLAELVDGMPVTDIGMLKRIAKRLRARHGVRTAQTKP